MTASPAERQRSPSRPSGLLVLAVALPLITGCAAGPDPQLTDDDGIVEQEVFSFSTPDEEVAGQFDAPIEEQGGVVVLRGEDTVSDARVVWTGLPCQLAPTAEVTKDGEGATVVIDPGPQVTGIGEDCPAVEDFHSLDLIFTPDVDPERVEARRR